MCGRFTLRTSADQFIEILGLLDIPDLKPRFNIAPTQSVAAVRQPDTHRELVLLHWGLIPFWAKDPKIGNRMINARAETVATKPAYRAAFKRRRCLIPADGFYEWKKNDAGAKQPFHIFARDKQPLAFAGLWESWHGSGDHVIESCTIITTSANAMMSELHERMPVILSEESWDAWLDPKQEDRSVLEPLLVPLADDRLTAEAVSTTVNNPRNETPECIEPVDL